MVMKYQDIQTMLSKLEERGKVNTGDLMMYFVSPFLKGLGYDIFDIDTVDIQQDKGLARVHVLDDIQMVISLKEYNYVEEQKDRIFVRVDVGKREMELYFKVLGKWESIVELGLEGNQGDKYVEVTKRIAKEQIDIEYGKKGERYLSETVLDYQLEQGVWENDFLKNSILKEIEDPSEEFKKLFAKRLHEDYTTREVSWILTKLQGLTGEGVLKLVVAALQETGDMGEYNTTSTEQGYKKGVEEVENDVDKVVEKEESEVEIWEDVEVPTEEFRKEENVTEEDGVVQEEDREESGTGESTEDTVQFESSLEEPQEENKPETRQGGSGLDGFQSYQDKGEETKESQESVSLGEIVTELDLGEEEDKKEDDEVLVEVVESTEEDTENLPKNLTDITNMFDFEEDDTTENRESSNHIEELILEDVEEEPGREDKKKGRFGGYKTSNRFY